MGDKAVKCLNCGKKLIHTKGRRPKKYCGAKCRMKYLSQHQRQFVQRSTYDALVVENEQLRTQIEELLAAGKDGRPKKGPNKAILANDHLTPPVPPKEEETPNLPPKNQSGDILAQIKAIRAEKVPDHQNTALGRKSWKLEQDRRIKELENQLVC
jgi:hypothetical protein